MRASRRASFDLAPNALSRLLTRRREAGQEILDLTESNPTRAGIAYPEREILEALASPGALVYEPSPRGLPEARAAVAAMYASRGVAVDPERILLTASTSEAYAYVFKLLCDPGDRVLTPAPSYPLFETLASVESVRADPYPIVFHGAWEIDTAALRAAVRAETRAVAVVSPNNPTGNFLKRRELSALREIGLPLICDEVFGDYAFGTDPERVPTVASEQDLLTFTFSGLSKVAGLPQMKLGWIVVSGPGAAEALERLEVIADAYLSPSTPVQVAAPRLVAMREVIGRAIRERVRENRDAAAALVGSASPCTLLPVEGGWYATLRFPRIRTEEEWILGLLEERGVLVHPGHFFDFHEEAYGVVSLLTPPAVLREGLARLLEYLG